MTSHPDNPHPALAGCGQRLKQAREAAGMSIDDVAARNPAGSLVIVSHGTFIRAFADHVTGLETRTPDNAHSVRFRGTPGAWTLVDGLVLA